MTRPSTATSAAASSRILTVLLAALLAGACGGEPPTGTPPPPPPPPAAVASVTVTPAQASVEVGATVQLAAQPRDAAGNGLSGRTVSWSSSDQSIASVGATGLVTGVTAGRATITAAAEGRSGTATVDVTSPTPVVVAAISPATLVEGQPATIAGSGFEPSPGANVVTIGGAAATVTQAAATSLTVMVPTLCRPKGTSVPVIVTVGSRSSAPASSPVAPASTLALAVGQQAIVSAPEARCLQFDAAAGTERYLVGVQSTAVDVSGTTALSVEGELAAAAAPAPPLQPVRTAPASGPAPSREELDRMARWRDHLMRTAAFYDSQREVVRRLAPSQARFAPGLGTAPSVPGSVQVGDQLTVKVPTFGAGSACTAFSTITARVALVTARGIFLEDQSNPEMLPQAVFDQAGLDFAAIYDKDVDWFGDPGDLDGNGRVVVVVTREVNRVASPPLGFVTAGDKLLGTACPASNEGEFFYMRSPDAAGVYTPGGYAVADLERDFANLLIHELVHIIQATRRLASGGELMASYVAEGLATAAQEVVGLELLGLAPGGNRGRATVYTTFGADRRAFFSFVGDLLAYFGFDFAGARAAGAPEQCTWSGTTAAGGAPGPCAFPNRLLYGVTWSLISQAIERHHGGAAGRKAVLRAFSQYAGPAGYPALEAVLGRPIATLVAEWAPMLYLDDRFPAATGFQQVDWNLRDVAGAWGSPNADLAVRQHGFLDFADAIAVRGGSVAFFEISGGARGATTIRVRDAAGRPAPDEVAVWAVRVQ